MIRKINKIMALVLIATSLTTIAPGGIFGIDARAAVSEDIGGQSNNVTLAGPDMTAMVPDGNTLIAMAESTTINPQLEGGAKLMFNAQGATSIVSEECGKLSYVLSDSLVEQISAQVLPALTEPITNAVVAQAKVATGGTIPEATLKYVLEPIVEANLKTALPGAIKTRFANIPVYQYTGKDASGTIKAQAFVIKGLVGSIVNTAVGNGAYVVNTYIAKAKNATYSSTALVPSLNLADGSTYNKAIDLSNGAKVIGDGMSINVVDSSNDKVYVINNPVYNMLKAQKGASISKDLNVIDFSGVTNLKGSLSTSLDVDGTSFSILSLALTTKDSTSKDYQYALPVGDYEKVLLDGIIDSYNLSTIGNTIKGMIKTGTYTMIPNINSEIGNLIDKSGVGNAISGVTDGLNNVSDSLNDLTDSLDDKSDDVDDAWDKVFDRFDNSEGWGKRDGYIYYYDKDGVSLKGVQKIKGKTYYFNRIDGAMETGWQIVDGKRCYFDKKKGYELFNQWIQDNEDKYFVGEDGPVKKMQWVNDGGKSYYLKADGKMTKDWLKIEDYWYYFNKDGSMATSAWKWSSGKWYYLKDSGQAANDWTQIGDKWFCFEDPSGEMQTGWFRANGSWYCTNDDGSMKTGWAYSSDGWSYLDEVSGKMKKNEWVTVDGKSYYFNINGIMVTGSRYINGTKYVFNSDGSLS
jgi:glucan-binding YG repeat protein